ncbi:beta-lactamase-like protein 2 [Aspergillus lentulus]|uniref:Beta-lactamase-like protein 2 n=1 Tax=Aspergillus lentulus TaxID=293939 RepID=A0AAN4PKL9_ASPLE|nr:beta-lactamase-like protein 2 [Aspergillus lentulus]
MANAKRGGYRQINQALNICAWEGYLDEQHARLPALEDVEQISPRVLRVLGQNEGKFTLQGTNTYIVGTGRQRLIIDTGQGIPEWASLIASTLADSSIELSHVLLTHWHGDHTGGVPDLLRLYPYLSDSIYKHSPGKGQQPISDGQVFKVEGATVRAVHSPGHSHDHMCFILEEENAIFTGDNVLGHGSSAVEVLSTWMSSLRMMQSLRCAVGYPAHGAVIRDLPAKLDLELTQKARREDRVVETLKQMKTEDQRNGARGKGSVTVQQLVTAMHGNDLDEQMRTMALEPFVDEVLRKLAQDDRVAFEMERQPKSLCDAAQLLQTADIISDTVQTIIAEWSAEVKASNGSRKQNAPTLPSRKLFDAQKTILAAVGKLTELVSDPSARILEVATQFQESRSLYIAAERRIPDLLAAGDEGGVHVDQISQKARIEPRKLSRILRYLCSIGIFKQTGPNTFANNGISAALASNEPLRAYVQLVNSEGFTSSDRLPHTLLDPDTGPSYDVAKTAWQNAVCTKKTRWEWIEERVAPEKLLESGGHYPGIPSLVLGLPPREDDGLVARPELEIMGLSMVGGGRVFGTAHVYDFPWASLGDALVVDVGGGVGGFPLQLSKVYPRLRFIVQDRGPVVKQGLEKVWPRENLEALHQGRVQFVEHSFFDTNPTEGADIYFLRYVLHDWSDDYCVRILSAIRQSMAAHSRLLICDQVMNTTIGDPDLESAPSPLPANYGYHTRFSHSRDITMMSCINGIERTPAEFKSLLQAAGLKLKKIWDCRSQVSLIEAVLPEANGFR